MARRSGLESRGSGLPDVEGDPRLAVAWRKASASSDMDCVEVASTGGSILIRDSKDAEHRVVLALPRQAFADLLSSLRSGHLH
ncbi:DUF397 domain-containing protein [Actinomadura fibrosa]|uniref:DUF397 domain-containing protein n=1 Tax=Actinomadura fibrosa TaxID=111802 RepID=A0ABW2XUW0_9ACTN|nr:DUF397 domain-containing protein [Actinomadura fibrosa]